MSHPRNPLEQHALEVVPRCLTADYHFLVWQRVFCFCLHQWAVSTSSAEWLYEYLSLQIVIIRTNQQSDCSRRLAQISILSGGRRQESVKLRSERFATIVLYSPASVIGHLYLDLISSDLSAPLHFSQLSSVSQHLILLCGRIYSFLG